MKQRKIVILAILTIFSVKANAQKNITNQNLVWYSYYVTLQFNDKWYCQTEVQERHFIKPTAQHQFLVRSHLHRALGTSGWETSVGMCLFFQNPHDPTASVKLTVPELRPHVEFTYKQKLSRLILDHRYRLETRFFHNTNTTRTELEDGFNFGHYRLRYRLQATIPIAKMDDEKALKIKASDEILINAGSKIINNVFDQNRVSLALSLDVSPNLTFDVGYLNWFQQRPTGDFYNRNILSFTLFQKLKL